MKYPVQVLAIPVLVLLASGTAFADSRAHYTLLEAPNERLPKVLILLPSDITVNELSAGGVTEKVDDWSKDATKHVESSLRNHLSGKPNVSVVNMPALNADEQALIEQHVALYDQVALAAFVNGRQWEHKNKHFDYTIGPGLRFLKERTGADTGVIAIGVDYVSTGGRKAAFLFAAMLGVAIPMGQSFVTVGLVEFETGNILWYDYNNSGVANLADFEGADGMVSTTLEEFPTVAKLAEIKATQQ